MFFFLASRSLFGRQTIVTIKHKSGKNVMFFFSFNKMPIIRQPRRWVHTLSYLLALILFISLSKCFLFYNFSSRFRWTERNEREKKKNLTLIKDILDCVCITLLNKSRKKKALDGLMICHFCITSHWQTLDFCSKMVNCHIVTQ